MVDLVFWILLLIILGFGGFVKFYVFLCFCCDMRQRCFVFSTIRLFHVMLSLPCCLLNIESHNSIRPTFHRGNEPEVTWTVYRGRVSHRLDPGPRKAHTTPAIACTLFPYLLIGIFDNNIWNTSLTLRSQTGPSFDSVRSQTMNGASRIVRMLVEVVKSAHMQKVGLVWAIFQKLGRWGLLWAT